MRISLSAVTPARILLTLGLVACLPAGAADDERVNRLLASQCAQCHGTNGYARGGFESIAGEEAKDLYEDLVDMKGEDRPENIMDHQALGYTDDQIRRIASYYAGLPEDPPEGGGSGSEEETHAEEEAAYSNSYYTGDEDEAEDEDEDEEDDYGG